jgi:predicted amidophosphoribosyltransferase
VEGAFAWGGARLDGQGLCLVDDVCTTGATAAAAAAALAAAGARPVDLIVLATVL